MITCDDMDLSVTYCLDCFVNPYVMHTDLAVIDISRHFPGLIGKAIRGLRYCNPYSFRLNIDNGDYLFAINEYGLNTETNPSKSHIYLKHLDSEKILEPGTIITGIDYPLGFFTAEKEWDCYRQECIV